MKHSVLLKDMTVRYGSQIIIENFSLSLKPGEFISIVGPSGCGKTTVLNLLAGLTSPTMGEAYVFSSKPYIGNPDIAYMFARDCLLPWRDVLANACFGMEIRGYSKAKQISQAKHMLKLVGLDQSTSYFPHQLSHGMRQRCALARTFCLDSKVLLMDEPFGALDAQTKIQLQSMLIDLWIQKKPTVLFITHDIGEAIAISDRVIVMSSNRGQVLEDISINLGRPRNIKKVYIDQDFINHYKTIWNLLENDRTKSQ